MNEGYSLKRLHGLEAKEHRQLYIDKKYPQLAVSARIDMYFTCLYAAQMSMKYLSKNDFCIAKEKISYYLQKISIDRHMLKTVPRKYAIWMFMSKISFWGTCKLRNLLKRGI